MIQIIDIVKNYGNVCALNIPELVIEKGELVGLVGNNGAGKTTFLRLLLDLIAPTRGHILLKNQNVDKYEEWKQITGSYLDENFLIPFLMPEEYFDFIGKSYGLSIKTIRERVESLNDLFTENILGAKRYIRDLSTGNRKKAGILAALMVRPELLILDEPFSNLDPTSQFRLKSHLRSLKKNVHSTMVISSHDLSNIVDVTDRIIIIESGEIIEDFANTSDTLPRLKGYFEFNNIHN